MSNANTPGNPSAPGALRKLLQADEKKSLRKKLLEAIVEDPQVVDGTNVSVTFEDTDMTKLHLIGTVSDKASKSRAEAIAREHGGDSIEVVNDLILE